MISLANIIFDPIIPVPLILGLAVAALALTGLAYLRGALNLPLKITLTTLRVGAILILLAILLRPMRNAPAVQKTQKPVFAVLADCSGSMCTEDVQGQSRFEAMRNALTKKRAGILVDPNRLPALWQDLAEDYQVRLFRFDETSKPLDLRQFEKQQPDGSGTRITTALNATLQAPRQQKLAGILLLSDGRENGAGESDGVRGMARALRAQKIPVWTVPLGSTVETKDAYVTARLSSNFLFVNQPGAIHVAVNATGYDNWYARVNLFRDNQYVTSEQVQLRNGFAKIDFPVKEPRRGTVSYRVEVDPLAGEGDRGNNQRALIARVVDKRTGVLVVEAEPYWDSKFLLRTLRDDYNVEVTSIFQINPRKSFAIVEKVSDNDLTSKQSLPGGRLPASKEELFQYDVIFFGHNLDRMLTAEQMKLLKDYLVERGGSIVFFRGQPYEQLVPELAALEPVQWDVNKLAAARFELTPEGKANPIFDFYPHPESAELIIRELPEMISITRIRAQKSLAVVLARTTSQAGPQERNPIATIAYQRYGKGKVMSIGATGMWRWAFMPERLKTYDDIYRRFWGQMLRWLMADSDFLPGQDIAFSLNKLTCTPGENVQIVIRTKFIDSTQYLPRLEIAEPGGGKTEIVPQIDAQQKNTFTAVYVPAAEGEYKVTLHNNLGQPREDTLQFMTYLDALEMRYVSADRPALEQLAKTTGGAALTLAELDRLPGMIKQFERATTEQSKPKDAWDRLGLFSILMTLLGLEWLIRRIAGLL